MRVDLASQYSREGKGCGHWMVLEFSTVEAGDHSVGSLVYTEYDMMQFTVLG